MVSTSRRDRESRFEFPHHQHVALSELIEKPVEFGPVPTSTRGLLTIHALAPGSFERRHLGGGTTNLALHFAFTIDEGLTWQPLSSLPSGFATDIAVDPASPETWYAGGSTGVFRSTDAGVTWQSLNLTLGSLFPFPAEMFAYIVLAPEVKFRQGRAGTKEKSRRAYAPACEVVL